MSKKKSNRRLRIAVLISGSGTTLQNLVNRIEDGRLKNIEIPIVISSRSTVEGVRRAEAAGLPVDVVRRKDYPTTESFSEHLTLTLDVYAVDLVVQAGWLVHWILPPRWQGRVINLHPSLLPKYGGKGFFGRHVHEAVLAAGETESGATVHWVNEDYDAGEVIAKRKCKVSPDDTPDTLAARVQEIERELLPDVIEKIRLGEYRPSRKKKQRPAATSEPNQLPESTKTIEPR